MKRKQKNQFKKIGVITSVTIVCIIGLMFFGILSIFTSSSDSLNTENTQYYKDSYDAHDDSRFNENGYILDIDSSVSYSDPTKSGDYIRGRSFTADRYCYEQSYIGSSSFTTFSSSNFAEFKTSSRTWDFFSMSLDYDVIKTLYCGNYKSEGIVYKDIELENSYDSFSLSWTQLNDDGTITPYIIYKDEKYEFTDNTLNLLAMAGETITLEFKLSSSSSSATPFLSPNISLEGSCGDDCLTALNSEDTDSSTSSSSSSSTNDTLASFGSSTEDTLDKMQDKGYWVNLWNNLKGSPILWIALVLTFLTIYFGIEQKKKGGRGK